MQGTRKTYYIFTYLLSALILFTQTLALYTIKLARYPAGLVQVLQTSLA